MQQSLINTQTSKLHLKWIKNIHGHSLLHF